MDWARLFERSLYDGAVRGHDDGVDAGERQALTGLDDVAFGSGDFFVFVKKRFAFRGVGDDGVAMVEEVVDWNKLRQQPARRPQRDQERSAW